MNQIVIDVGFGDAGKGLTVDFLCQQHLNRYYEPSAIVVRFSGGHQVSHTVDKNGVRHIFNHFGAGTLANIPTYWSQYCTVSPLVFMNELGDLLNLGIQPKIFIDYNAPITTPYDVAHNRTIEWTNKHGSCGCGYGATIQREEKFYSLTFRDLFYPEIFRTKLDEIGKFYKYNIDQAEIDQFLYDCNMMVNMPGLITACDDTILNGYADCIYEGSQGLLLDQHYGFFPNVTRANTGTTNLQKWITERQVTEFFLVTRAYQTRHGNGFMTNEDRPNNIIRNINESNVTNPYQGKFRISLLDLSLLEYSLGKDEMIRNSKNKTLVITCLDHVVNDYRFTYKGDIVYSRNQKEFVTRIGQILKFDNILTSETQDSKNMRML